MLDDEVREARESISGLLLKARIMVENNGNVGDREVKELIECEYNENGEEVKRRTFKAYWEDGVWVYGTDGIWWNLEKGSYRLNKEVIRFEKVCAYESK